MAQEDSKMEMSNLCKCNGNFLSNRLERKKFNYTGRRNCSSSVWFNLMESARLVVTCIPFNPVPGARLMLTRIQKTEWGILFFLFIFLSVQLRFLLRRYLWPNWRKIALLFFVSLLYDKVTGIVFIRVIERTSSDNFLNLHTFSDASS